MRIASPAIAGGVLAIGLSLTPAGVAHAEQQPRLIPTPDMCSPLASPKVLPGTPDRLKAAPAPDMTPAAGVPHVPGTPRKPCT